jgi:hypothetical protein
MLVVDVGAAPREIATRIEAELGLR